MANFDVSRPVDQANLTWNAEGQEGGKYHSRKLHVPSKLSGLTLGRGYDMATKSASKIKQELIMVGVDKKEAEAIAKAAGKRGNSAEKISAHEDLNNFEIGTSTQEKLFNLSYHEMESDVERLMQKTDVVEAYGSVNLDNLDPKIKDLIVDLRFRGDYDGRSRALIQKHVVNNDIESLAAALSKKDNWKNVPKDRFDRRVEYMNKAVEEKKKINAATNLQNAFRMTRP